jgi:hypothetical protein
MNRRKSDDRAQQLDRSDGLSATKFTPEGIDPGATFDQSSTTRSVRLVADTKLS